MKKPLKEEFEEVDLVAMQIDEMPDKYIMIPRYKALEFGARNVSYKSNYGGLRGIALKINNNYTTSTF